MDCMAGTPKSRPETSSSDERQHHDSEQHGRLGERYLIAERTLPLKEKG